MLISLSVFPEAAVHFIKRPPVKSMLKQAFKKNACYFLIIFNFLGIGKGLTQDQRIADSLRIIYEQQKLPDTAKFELLLDLSFNETRDLNQAVRDAENLIQLAKQSGRDKYLRAGYFLKGTKLRLLTRLDEAVQAFMESAELAKKLHDTRAEGDAYGEIAANYSTANDHMNAKYYYRKSIETLRKVNNPLSLASALNNAGDEFLKTKNYDSALITCREAKELFETSNYSHGIGYAMGNIGMAYAGLGKNNLAESNINDAVRILEKNQDYYPICVYLISMSHIYVERNDKQKALGYARRSLQLAEQYKLNEQIRDANLQLAQLYDEVDDIPQSYSHYKNYIIYRDTVNNINSLQKMFDLRTEFDRSLQKTALDESNKKRKLYGTLLSVALFVAVVIGILVIIVFRNYRQKQKAYTLLTEQKKVIERQRDKTDQALKELKQAQAHLVQSEKMASLGQLTAGIAHEIQNPLNFVNNFSEVNKELLSEVSEALRKENYEEAQIIAVEILNNEEKINQHGKRAEAIVKGMLEHSRSNASEKRLTSINILADEYIRLAVHGFRVKEKAFNLEVHTAFDSAASDLNIVPQEIGRVFLNLLNNAFYAISEKSKEGKTGYIPSVSVSTKRLPGELAISIKDNGIGIPTAIREKIFQPFFTTKGPGVGTGLGLSLSYDIIKAHGGEMKVEAEEGVGSEFIITLPVL